ncbi:FecR domain-containing protein [Bdellovibrionota bacterium FG-1]
MNEKKRKLFSFISNLFFGFLSFLCFYQFADNAITLDVGGGRVGVAIAKVRSGGLERKRVGMVVFSPVETGGPLYHRDAIWVGAGQHASIEFSDGSRLEMQEKTFLILLARKGEDIKKGAIEVLRGEANLKASGGGPSEKLVAGTDQRFSPESDLSNSRDAPLGSGPDAPVLPGPSPVVDVTQLSVYPKADTIFYLLKGGEAKIPFAWPDPLTGTFVIRNGSKTIIHQAQLVSRKTTEARLKMNDHYIWQVENSGGKMLLGPFQFQLLPFKSGGVTENLKDVSDKNIEIIQ